jgi:hypothetical protein
MSLPREFHRSEAIVLKYIEVKEKISSNQQQQQSPQKSIPKQKRRRVSSK